MTRDEFLNDIIDACAFYHWEIMGAYKHYQIIAVTSSFVQISVIHFDQKEQWAEVLDFQNDDKLIDNMLDRL